MDTPTKVMLLITSLKGEEVGNGLEEDDTSFHIMEEIFSSGNCGNLAVVLCLAFNGAIPCLVRLPSEKHIHHVVTNIGGRLYDITGDVTNKYTVVDVTTVAELISNKDHVFYGNYSFGTRGPMV